MKAKDVEKITAAYTAIKELDQQIIKLDKAAKLIAERGEDVTISMTLPEKSNKKKKVLDEDGSLCGDNNENPFRFSFMSSFYNLPSAVVAP